jgi:hypothetical protein
MWSHGATLFICCHSQLGSIYIWQLGCTLLLLALTNFSLFCGLSENLKFCTYLNFIIAQAAGQIHGREDYREPTSATGYDRRPSFLNIILILCVQISLKIPSFGRRFLSTIELRIPNSSLGSIVGAGGVNLAEIRQV